MDRLEHKMNRNHIVITAIQLLSENIKELTERMRNFIKQYLNIDAKFSKAYKIGPKTCKIVILKQYPRENRDNEKQG